MNKQLATSPPSPSPANITQADIDALEVQMMSKPAVRCPLTHRFTKGLYIREVFLPAGTMLTTMVHNTEHPYVISQGVVDVIIEGVGVQRLSAPYTGITQPGTRRVIRVIEDTVWTTFHPNPDDCRDVDEIQRRIITPRDEHLQGLAQELPANLLPGGVGGMSVLTRDEQLALSISLEGACS